jgi:hypothetical protein
MLRYSCGIYIQQEKGRGSGEYYKKAYMVGREKRGTHIATKVVTSVGHGESYIERWTVQPREIFSIHCEGRGEIGRSLP